MQFPDKLPSLFDEVSWGSDSFNRSSLYRIDQSFYVRGSFPNFDLDDYYKINLPAGNYTVYVTTDGLNSTSIFDSSFSTSIVNSSGVKVLGESLTHPDIYTDKISFTYDGTGDYYLKISSFTVANFNYRAAIYSDGPTLDTTPPIITNASPTVGATGVNLDTNIQFAFSEVVRPGSGNVTIRSGSPAGPIFAQFPATQVTTQVFSVLTIDPPTNFAKGTTYFVSIDVGTFLDIAGNPYVGLSGYSFTTANANGSPVFAAQSKTVNGLSGASVAIQSLATDPDGDAITYQLGTPQHGTVTGNSGNFVYTPIGGYVGPDSFTLTASDGLGGTAVQTINLTIASMPTRVDWKLFASDGFSGDVAGYGLIFGSAGFQKIIVPNVPGAISLDASFNRGGDIVTIGGNASAWSVVRSGSSAIFYDGDTLIQVPVGTAGMAVQFDDGIRNLRFDTAAGSMRIGSQAFATTLTAIIAPVDGTQAPTGANASATARVYVKDDGTLAIGGKASIFGTAGEQQIIPIQGSFTLDPSFNRGGDEIASLLPASDFKAVRQGSSVLLDSEFLDILVPVGTVGTTLTFAGGDHRALIFDPGAGGIRIADQLIGTSPVSLTAFG